MRPDPQIQNPADNGHQERNIGPSAPLAHLSVWPIPLFRLLGQLGSARKWGGYGLMCNFVRKSS